MKNHLERSKMRSKEIGGFVLMLIFSHFCVLALSSSPLQQETLPSGFKQGKSSRVESAYKQSKNGVPGHGTSQSAISENVRFQSGIGHANGGGGSRPTNPGESGGNGGSRTPTGTSYIPVYAAGAVNNRHPSHRGAANCNRIGASTLIAAATASFLQLYATLRHG